MTVQQMLNSLPILQRLLDLKLPIKKAYAVYSLAKQINEQRDFFIKEEKKLIEKFQADFMDDGSIKFNSQADKTMFMSEHADLMQYEVPDLKVIELSFGDLENVEFTPKDIMALEGVIKFIE